MPHEQFNTGINNTGINYGSQGLNPTPSFAASKVTLPNFYSSVFTAEAGLDTLLARAKVMADKLCGSIPDDPAKAGLTPVGPGGIFDDIAILGNRMNYKIAAIQEALDRIDRAIG